MSQAHAYSRFRRALLTKDVNLIDAAARELRRVKLEDALRVLLVLAERRDARFERAAARFAARVMTERRLSRAERACTSHPDLGDFITGLTLAADGSRDHGEAASVMTVHRAKGLEFDHVWIAGVEEGLFPHARSVREGTEPEERRLAYVAVTRARRTLHASWAWERAGRQREPSRYLAQLGAGALPTTSAQCARRQPQRTE